MKQTDKKMVSTASPNKWLHIELPTMDYREAWTLQRELVAAQIEKRTDIDIVLSLEHPEVFTLGRRGGMENLRVAEDFLKQAGISVVPVERGGNITFHGPGQLVVYPIIDVRRAGLRVGDYLTCLEEVMLQTALAWGIPAGRNRLNRGIWVGDKKLGSVGISIRRGIAFHGLALNVNVSLEPFGWINPCGLPGIEMTSMERELSQEIPMHEVRTALVRNVERIFGVRLVNGDLAELWDLIKTPRASLRRVPIETIQLPAV